MNGETLDIHDYNNVNFSQSDMSSTLKPNIFFIFNSRDEIEAHEFIKRDPLYQQNFVKDWTIKELDLIHAERDDELVLRNRFL